jgi:hypothetical protein
LPRTDGAPVWQNNERWSIDTLVRPGAGDFPLKIEVFGDIPKLNVQVHLMPEEEYYALTSAPEWTNAIFYEGEILIPVRKTTSHESINRTIRHEFTHAVVDAMSDGKCPGWLDEGLAQWAEGEDNPALSPALLKWLGNNYLILYRHQIQNSNYYNQF